MYWEEKKKSSGLNSHWQWILYEICDIFYLPSSRWSSSSSLSLEDTLSGKFVDSFNLKKWFRRAWQDWCRLMAFDEEKMIGKEIEKKFLIDLHFDKFFDSQV